MRATQGPTDQAQGRRQAEQCSQPGQGHLELFTKTTLPKTPRILQAWSVGVWGSIGYQVQRASPEG